MLPGDYKRRQDALTLYGWLPEWKEIKEKKLKAKKDEAAFTPAFKSYDSNVKSHNVLAEMSNTEMDTFDKEYIKVTNEVADGDFTPEELDKFITMTKERNVLIDKWVPKLKSSEQKIDTSLENLEKIGPDIVVKDEEGLVIGINEPTLTIGSVLPWKGDKIEIKMPVSEVNKQGLVRFTKSITTKTLGRATGEFLEPTIETTIRIDRGTSLYPKLPTTKKIDIGKQVGKVSEVTYSVAPYFIPGSAAVGPFTVGAGSAAYIAEFGAKAIEPTITKGKYGGPESSWSYVKQHPIETVFAGVLGAGIISTAFKPTITGIGTLLPKGKKFGPEFYKVNKKFISKGQEAFVTTPGREFVRTKLGIKSIQPYYRASDYAKLSKTHPAKLTKIIDTLRRKRAIYDPTRYIFGKYPSTAPTKTGVVKFLKLKTDPFLIGRAPTVEEIKGVTQIVAGKTIGPVKYQKGEYVRYDTTYRGSFKTDIRVYKDLNLKHKLGLKDIDVFVPNKIKALGGTYEPANIAAKRGVKIITGPTVKNVYTNVPQITQFPQESIKFFQSGKTLPGFMKGTKVLSAKPIHIFEETLTRIVSIPSGFNAKGEVQYKYYVDALKKGQPYLGGTLKPIRGRVVKITGGKKLDSYVAHQTMSGDSSNTNFATIKKSLGYKKGLLNVDLTNVKSTLTNRNVQQITKIKYGKGPKSKDIIEQSRNVESIYSKPLNVQYEKHAIGDFIDDLTQGTYPIEKGGPTFRSKELITGQLPKIKQKELFSRIIQTGHRQMAGGIQMGRIPVERVDKSIDVSMWRRLEQELKPEDYKKQVKFKDVTETKINKKMDKWISSTYQTPAPTHTGGTGGPGYEGAYYGQGAVEPTTQLYRSHLVTTPQLKQIAHTLNVPAVTPMITPLGIMTKAPQVAIQGSQLAISLLAAAPTVIQALQPTQIQQLTTTQVATTQVAKVSVKTAQVTKAATITPVTTPTPTQIIPPIVMPPIVVPPVIKPPRVPTIPARRIPIIFPLPFQFVGKKKMKPKKKTPVSKKPGYQTYIKPLKQKTFVKANLNPLTKKKAKDLGSYITDTTLGATYKIKKTKKNALKPRMKVPRDYADKTKHKFRAYRIVKGKKKKMVNTWIEKRNRRLDTPGEIERVQVLARITKMKNAAREPIPKPKPLAPFKIKTTTIKTNTKFL